jgi:arylsulfatase A-like enzyme
VLKKITEVAFNKAPIEVCFEAARKCMPNVDKLREQGMRFTDFHAAATCATSRGALMSSRYPQSFGIYGNDDMEVQIGESHFPISIIIFYWLSRTIPNTL